MLGPEDLTRDSAERGTDEAPTALGVGFESLPAGSGRLSGAELLQSVLNQFTLNFLLNEEASSIGDTGTSSPKLATPYLIPQHRPRRQDSQIERLHQSRVSVRRLRSLLRTFESLLDPDRAGPLRDELSWYADVLGVSRDLDVLSVILLDENQPIREPVVWGFLNDRLRSSLDAATVTSHEVVASVRYRRLISRLAELDDQISFQPSAFRPARKALTPLLDPVWREVREAGRVAQRDSSNQNLHQLRIRLKRLQYAGEVVAIVEGRPAIRVARSASRLQTKLGSVHDGVIAEEWLRSLARAEPVFAVQLELLADYQSGCAKRIRKGWREDFRRAGRQWRRW